MLQVLDTTLLADQLQRQSAAIREKADAADAPPLPEGVATAIERYNELDASLKGTENQFIRLSGEVAERYVSREAALYAGIYCLLERV